MFSESIYNELIGKSKDLIRDYESKISKSEKVIERMIKNDATLDEFSKKAKEIVIILREVEYSYGLLIREYNLSNKRLLTDHQEVKIELFDSNISIAPTDKQFIVELDAYFMKKVGQKRYENSLAKDRIFFYENVKKDTNNLTEPGKLDLIRRNICGELKRLFIVWENLKILPKLLHALQK